MYLYMRGVFECTCTRDVFECIRIIVVRIAAALFRNRECFSSDEVAVQQVNARLAAEQPSIAQVLTSGIVGDLPSSAHPHQEERN